jgi:electron transfer flavoprotein alpha subunit
VTTLLIAEHDEAALKEATSRALTAARELGSEVHVLVAGRDCGGAATAAAALAGVAKVLHVDSADPDYRLAEPLADLIVSLAGDYDALMAPATTFGKNLMPRVAALLDVMQISDIVAVVAPDTFARPIYAGNAIETVRSLDGC